VIFFAIFLSSIKLVYDTYITDDINQQTISSDIDIFFAAFFLLEAMMKAIAFGLVLNPHSYLRDSWSVLDFIIVCASLIDVSVE
jgi:voltage-dependent calcium channel L type alpha-1C